MDILHFIKNHKSTRKYKNIKIPESILKKILEAGRWGPSVMGMQPWKFILIQNREKIKEIYNLLKEKSYTLDDGGCFIFKSTLQAIESAPIVIAIYNTGDLKKFTEKFGRKYSKIVKIADISSISAAIQNMILMADYLGIGSCWLVSPVISENHINKIINNADKKENLIGLLTLGYSEKKNKRSKRKLVSDIIKVL